MKKLDAIERMAIETRNINPWTKKNISAMAKTIRAQHEALVRCAVSHDLPPLAHAVIRDTKEQWGTNEAEVSSGSKT